MNVFQQKFLKMQNGDVVDADLQNGGKLVFMIYGTHMVKDVVFPVSVASIHILSLSCHDCHCARNFEEVIKSVKALS